MNPKGLTQEEVRRAERLVSQLPDISSCQIATDDHGHITEVHVVSTSPKSPNSIASDVVSCIKGETGIDVDPRAIGVVVFDSGTAARDIEDELIEEFPIEEFPSRFAFQSVNLFSGPLETKAEVELVRDSMESFGSSTTRNPLDAQAKVIAEATLRAVSEFLDESVRLCLGQVLKTELGDKAVYVVRVDLIGRQIAKALAGCSVIAGNEQHAVVFATLDAVNRVIGKLEFKGSIEYKIK